MNLCVDTGRKKIIHKSPCLNSSTLYCAACFRNIMSTQNKCLAVSPQTGWLCFYQVSEYVSGTVGYTEQGHFYQLVEIGDKGFYTAADSGADVGHLWPKSKLFSGAVQSGTLVYEWHSCNGIHLLCFIISYEKSPWIFSRNFIIGFNYEKKKIRLS